MSNFVKVRAIPEKHYFEDSPMPISEFLDAVKTILKNAEISIHEEPEIGDDVLAEAVADAENTVAPSLESFDEDMTEKYTDDHIENQLSKNNISSEDTVKLIQQYWDSTFKNQTPLEKLNLLIAVPHFEIDDFLSFLTKSSYSDNTFLKTKNEHIIIDAGASKDNVTAELFLYLYRDLEWLPLLDLVAGVILKSDRNGIPQFMLLERYRDQLYISSMAMRLEAVLLKANNEYTIQILKNTDVTEDFFNTEPMNIEAFSQKMNELKEMSKDFMKYLKENDIKLKEESINIRETYKDFKEKNEKVSLKQIIEKKIAHVINHLLPTIQDKEAKEQEFKESVQRLLRNSKENSETPSKENTTVSEQDITAKEEDLKESGGTASSNNELRRNGMNIGSFFSSIQEQNGPFGYEAQNPSSSSFSRTYSGGMKGMYGHSQDAELNTEVDIEQSRRWLERRKEARSNNIFYIRMNQIIVMKQIGSTVIAYLNHEAKDTDPQLSSGRVRIISPNFINNHIEQRKTSNSKPSLGGVKDRPIGVKSQVRKTLSS